MNRPALLTLLALAIYLPAGTAQTIIPHFPVVDGNVTAITHRGNAIYLGGLFDRIAPYTGRFVGLDASTGLLNSSFPPVNNAVLSAVPDGSGGWYIGGTFNRIGDQSFDRLAHIRPDGTPAPAFDLPISQNGTVNTLFRSGNILYVGGSFASVDGQPRANLAAIDLTTNTLLPWNPSPNSTVNALATDGTTVFVGGAFTTIGGGNRNRLAALDPTTGLVTNWDALYSGASGTIRALLLDDALYVGGDFSGVIGGFARTNLARLSAVNGLATQTFAPNPNASVSALLIDGATLYIGGNFSLVSGQPRSRIAGISALGAVPTAFDVPVITGTVSAITKSGGTLYAGGSFDTIAPAIRYNLAAFDVTTGDLTVWDPAAMASVSVLVADNGTIFTGGSFAAVNGLARRNAAAVDASTGDVTAWDPSPNSGVLSLAASDDAIFAGGAFTSIGGFGRLRLASLDPTTGAANPFNPSSDGFVYSIALHGGVLYVGGTFTTIASQSRSRLAALSPVSGNALAWNPAANNEVSSLAVDGTTVFVGGNFTVIGGQPRSRLAALDATSGAVLPTWIANADGDVRALEKVGTRLYVGGKFETIAAANRTGLAALDITSGVVDAWNPLLIDDPVSNPTLSIAVSQSTVFAGNLLTFDFPDGSNRPGIAGIDASTAQPTAFDPDTTEVLALRVVGDRLFVGNAGRYRSNGRTNFAAFQLNATPTTTPLPPNASRPTLRAKGKTTLKTSRRRVVLKGSATDATLVQFKSGKGGFKKAKGSAEKWKIPVRLTSKRTVVKVRATGPAGTSKILKFKITRK